MLFHFYVSKPALSTPFLTNVTMIDFFFSHRKRKSSRQFLIPNPFFIRRKSKFERLGEPQLQHHLVLFSSPPPFAPSSFSLLFLSLYLTFLTDFPAPTLRNAIFSQSRRHCTAPLCTIISSLYRTSLHYQNVIVLHLFAPSHRHCTCLNMGFVRC